MPLVPAPRRLAEAHWFRVERIRQALIARLVAQWTAADPEDPPIEQSVALTLAAQRLIVKQTDAYFTTTAVAALGDAPQPIGLDPERLIGKRSRRGIALEEIFHRTALVQRQDGFERGLAYLRQQTITGSSLTSRFADHAAMDADPRVVGYIRVNNPGGGKVCGMCVAAATRMYHKADLKPLHHACRCTVQTVYDSARAGGTIDRKRLEAVYEASDGATDFASLGRLRFSADQLPPAVQADAIRALDVRITLDRELGPMLTARRHDTAFAVA